MRRSGFLFGLLGLITVSGLALGGAAQAGTVYTVNIDGTQWGCSQCDGGPAAIDTIGSTVDLVNDSADHKPLQLTLGPGTYEVTNAQKTLGNYSAWRFNGGSTNWVWSYVIGIDKGSNKADIFRIGTLNGILDSQETWQNSTDRHSAYWDNGEHVLQSLVATPDYRDTFTLTTPTVLDFFIIDYYLPDNAGGISLNITNISQTPIPAALPLFMTALAGLGFMARRRKAA